MQKIEGFRGEFNKAQKVPQLQRSTSLLLATFKKKLSKTMPFWFLDFKNGMNAEKRGKLLKRMKQLMKI